MSHNRSSRIQLADIQHVCCEPDCEADPAEGYPVPLCVWHISAVVRHFMEDARQRFEYQPGRIDVGDIQAINRASAEVGVRAKKTPPSVVYFLRCGERLKIGTTTDLQKRLKGLPPGDLLGTIPGGVDVEREMHHRFRGHLIQGEWFMATPTVLTLLSQICRQSA